MSGQILMESTNVSQSQLIEAIDLSQINLYFQLKKGWSEERVTQAVTDYRFFLSRIDSRFNTSPTSDVDDIWHRHILHTKQYAYDCMRVFGKFIHHEPFEISVENTAQSVSNCGGSTNCQVASCSNGDGSDND